jgi:tryptophan halogenase
LLGNKKESVNINDLIGGNIYNNVIKNFVLLDQENPISWHFDAGKFINFFSKIAQKNNKVNFIDSKILNGCIYDDEIKYINDKDKKIVADYYIFATGDQKINVDFLNINYKDMSNILLTDTALAFPLKYKNKKQELHPYTVAKTMNNGWRWITPTWSRIGTGYVFSSKHIDPEKAKKEFVEDVGIKKIEPFLVDFTPKINEKPMKKNWCTIGMASGFLEPLDAPGLSITIDQVMDKIPKYLKFINDNKNLHQQEYFLEQLNNYLFKIYKFWCCFILTQYKTCYRKDTKFWKDQKNVFWEEYDTIIDTIRNSGQFPGWAGMINHTVAAKDVGWKTFSELKPYQILEKTGDLINHMEYIVKIRNKEF